MDSMKASVGAARAALVHAERGRRKQVEQPARRVRSRREEALVRERHLERRDLQASQQRFHARGDVPVLEDVVEQHADDVDGHRVDGAEVGALRRRLDALHDIDQGLVAGRALGAVLAVHARELVHE